MMDNLENYLKQYYLHKRDNCNISEEKLKEWLKKGEEKLTHEHSPILRFQPGENLFQRILKEAKCGFVSIKEKKYLCKKTGMKLNELERIQVIEGTLEQSYLPKDGGIIAKIIFFLKMPLSSMRKHVYEKAIKANEAMALIPKASLLYKAYGVDEQEPGTDVMSYKNVLSQNFWDNIAEKIDKEGRYELLD
jgi:hypothetical protein